MPNITVYSVGNHEDFGVYAIPTPLQGTISVEPHRYNTDSEVWLPKITPPSGKGLGLFRRLRLRFAVERGNTHPITVSIRVYKAGDLPNDSVNLGNPVYTKTINNFAGGTINEYFGGGIVSESIIIAIEWTNTDQTGATPRYKYNTGTNFELSERRYHHVKLTGVEVDVEDYTDSVYKDERDA